MPTETASPGLPLETGRVLRFALTTALALAVAYGLALPVPYMAPLFAVMFCAKPGPPMGVKALVGVVLAIALIMGSGLLLTPMLQNYAITAIVVIAAGLYLSSYLSSDVGKGPVGTLIGLGFTVIPAVGLVDLSLASALIEAMVTGVFLAILCQWAVYPLFPENDVAGSPASPAQGELIDSNWIAIRAIAVVMPSFLLTLTNPALYVPFTIKALVLAQQASVVNVRSAARELVGSTLAGGCCAVLFWLCLKLHPNLWMYFLWTLFSCLYFGTKLFGVSRSRFSAAFWQNTAVTCLLLLGPAVQDSANGKDVYAAFFVRMCLFILVSVYAVGAVFLLERWRMRRSGPERLQEQVLEAS